MMAIMISFLIIIINQVDTTIDIVAHCLYFELRGVGLLIYQSGYQAYITGVPSLL